MLLATTGAAALDVAAESCPYMRAVVSLVAARRLVPAHGEAVRVIELKQCVNDLLPENIPIVPLMGGRHTEAAVLALAAFDAATNRLVGSIETSNFAGLRNVAHFRHVRMVRSIDSRICTRMRFLCHTTTHPLLRLALPRRMHAPVVSPGPCDAKPGSAEQSAAKTLLTSRLGVIDGWQMDLEERSMLTQNAVPALTYVQGLATVRKQRGAHVRRITPLVPASHPSLCVCVCVRLCLHRH